VEDEVVGVEFEVVVRLLAHGALHRISLRAHPRSFVDSVPDQAELRLSISDHPRDYWASVNTNFYLQRASVFHVKLFGVLDYFHAKVSDSHRMVPIQKPRFNFPFSIFEAAAGHVCFANGFNLLKTILVTHLVEAIVDLIKEV